jgi:hypothetical protein
LRDVDICYLNADLLMRMIVNSRIWRANDAKPKDALVITAMDVLI